VDFIIGFVLKHFNKRNLFHTYINFSVNVVQYFSPD